MTKSEGNQLISSTNCLRAYMKEKITNHTFNEFSDERNELLNILKRTVNYGESDSVLIVGPRGCGKSHVVKFCLGQLQRSFCENDYLVVNLNGLVHTDDNQALRAIIEQLHVDELDGSQITGSFADNLQFVLQSLKGGDKTTTKPIIFILEEFQLFCTHRNQTLLYNLFDISKSAQAPVCVVGITCRYDITELLEKRVSSRFSHRQILLMPESNLETRISQFREYLLIGRKTPKLRKVKQDYIQEWDDNIESLMKMPNVTQRIRRQLEIDPSRRAFKNVVFCLISKVTHTNPLITVSNIEESFRRYYVDEKVESLKDLSVLELCLVIAMCHHVDIYDGEPFNFEMIVDKYLKFAHRNSAVQITQRPILLKAFERMKELELILPITISSRNQKKEYILYNLMVTKSQMKLAINSYSELPTDVSQWAFSSVA